ncbi:hypothetical protein OEZ86_003231 [Tetradesmus obliquus]|nr:hypothetical protein OEZ86_003231 [Tetradesmus obliquus]
MASASPSDSQGDDAGAQEDEPRKTMQCQAVGCSADLRIDGKYCMKRRLCREHLKAISLLRKRHGPDLWRFCQQCGKLERLDAFDGRRCRQLPDQHAAQQ